MDKKEQAKLLTEIMQADEKDGLYDQPTSLTTKTEVYKKVFDFEREAKDLIAKFGSISIHATMKQTEDGKYVVKFII